MEEKLSEKLPFKSENWGKDAQAVLEDYLNDGDETKFLKCMEEIQEIPLWVANDLLTISAQRNMQQTVKAILNSFEGKYLNVREAARMAVQNGHHVILGELLRVEPEISHHLILSVCLKLGEPRKRGVNDTLLRSNLKTCLELILKHVNVHVIDIADISSVLSAYFDVCSKKMQPERGITVYDYRCLTSRINIFSKQNTTHRGICETEVFLDIAHNKNLNHLLKHPLLSSFLYRKWYRVSSILYMNIAFYVVFYILLNTYILNMIYESSPNENGTQAVNDSFNVVLNTHTTHTQSTQRVFVIVLWLLFTIREILLFACCPRRYLMIWENWLQIMLLIFTLILLCGAGAWSRVVVVFLSARLTNLISRHPKISIKFEMFWTVSRVIVCSLLLCMFLIIGPFGLTFYILFKNIKHFSNPRDSFFKTLIMVFTGEFDSNDIPVDSYPVLSNIVLVLFAFIIIVFFLAIGLVFSDDTNKMLSKAKLNGLISRICLIVYVEDIALGKPFSWLNWFSRGNSCLLRWNPFGFLTKRIFLSPLYLENDKLDFFHHYGHPAEQWSRGSVIKKGILKSAVISKEYQLSHIKKIKST